MKNVSIRVKILAAVVAVNLLGAAAVMIYLHEAYIATVDTHASAGLAMSRAAFDEIRGDFEEVDLTDAEQVGDVLNRMSAITAADYGLLLDKEHVSEEEYRASVEEAGLPNRWNEREANVLIASTNEDLNDKIYLEIDAASVPDIGRMVGVANGACSLLCHEDVGAGDYVWSVEWSPDRFSRAHAAFPVSVGGEQVAIVYSIEDVSWLADDARDTMYQTFYVIAITLVFAMVVIGGLIDTLVFFRLRRMVTSMEDITLRLAGGDFDAKYQASGSRDEVGRFESLYASLIELMSSTLKSLSKR